MSDEKFDTLGHQKRTNYALNPALTREGFVQAVLSGLTAPPAYFPQNVLLNIKGYEDIGEVIRRSTVGLSADAFQLKSEAEAAFILDTRNASDFAKGFIPRSINIGLTGSFASWLGTIITDVKQKIMLVCEPGKEEEAIIRMARVGFDQCLGYLKGGIQAWKDAGKPMDQIETMDASEFYTHYIHGEGKVLDVRKESEYLTEHIIGAQNLPLDYVGDHIAEVSADDKTFVHCAAGYRSMIFISYLRKAGYHNLIDISSGFNGLKALNKFPLSEKVEQSTEL